MIRLVGVLFGLLFAGCAMSTEEPSDVAVAALTLPPSPGGTYSDWYFAPTSLDALEWSVTAVEDPAPSLAAEGLLHYYAYNFSVSNSTSAVGGGYAGFQTNGIFNGQPQGKAINFSIWGSNGGLGPDLVNLQNPESGGAQIMTRFNWVAHRKYKFRLASGVWADDAMGRWWTLDITDTTTGVATWIGDIRAQMTIGGLPSGTLRPHTSAFGEDLHWWRSLDGSVVYPGCSAFQRSSHLFSSPMGFVGTTPVAPTAVTSRTNSGTVYTGSNGFKTEACPVTVYVGENKSVQHNLGYWETPPPNVTACSISSVPNDRGITGLLLIAAAVLLRRRALARRSTPSSRFV